MNFEKLDAILKARKISHRRLAIETGINANSLATAFKRKSGLSFRDVFKIARYLNVSYLYLLDCEDYDLAQDDETGELVGRRYLSGRTLMAEYGFTIDEIDQKMNLDYAFVSLNATGRTEAVKRIQELTMLPQYTKTDSPATDESDNQL